MTTRQPLTYTSDERPEYAFCESVHATGRSPWHIRKVPDGILKLGGGITTPSLCGTIKITGFGANGWDLNVRITDQQLTHACPRCVVEYLRLGI